jgi:hypothetical protein
MSSTQTTEATEMAKTHAQRNREYYERIAGKGLKRVEMFIPEQYVADIRRYGERLRKLGEREQESKA